MILTQWHGTPKQHLASLWSDMSHTSCFPVEAVIVCTMYNTGMATEWPTNKTSNERQCVGRFEDKSVIMHSKKTDKWNSWPCYLNVSSLTLTLPNSSPEQLSHICPDADWGWIPVETLGKAKAESFSLNTRDSPLCRARQHDPKNRLLWMAGMKLSLHIVSFSVDI